MHGNQQPTIGDIASRFEKTLISTPSSQREVRAKELAAEANKQAKAAGLTVDFGIYIPKALKAIARHEDMKSTTYGQ
ncbi:hypothetical protein [Aeromonas salmonicida]|uniref:hypothetical protein n=1 Tax=Aeromonas salmonicida TaxID=645 RepID=UPI001C628EC7|nr:hypothetical protein [Aeromonas salmonicida]QYH27405.1 hypothetical protein G9H43_18670 [Aeromonas salmonicida subsp. masoucida]QYH31694.1 hypothetical protein G9457_18790 [Aeromonas salmonicida subsp. masoucida]WGI38376.1 hypothetical protein QDU35_18890 [Aeromonas salmonicida]